MYFLIDYENVKEKGLAGVEYLEKEDYITFFYSKTCDKCQNRWLDTIASSGCKVDICKLVKTGKNGLDFYIASRIGQYFGAGNKGPVAIISQDKGYQAVRDYWNLTSGKNNKVFMAHTIGKAILAGSAHPDKIEEIKHAEERTSFEVFQARYEERVRIQNILQDLFAGTDLEDQIGNIEDLLNDHKNTGNKRDIYLDSLHRFGRNQGLTIYRKILPALITKD